MAAHTGSIKIHVLLKVDGSPVSNEVGVFELPVEATLDRDPSDHPDVTARVVFDTAAIADALEDAARHIRASN